MIRLTIALTLCASLHAAPKPIHPLEDARIDVSHSLGFALGGLGTGYVAFGQYGFVREFLGDREPESMAPGTWEYTAKDAKESAVPAVEQATKRLEEAKSAATPPAPAVLAKLEKALAKARAAGEWNRSLNEKGEVVVLSSEVCKDTPRFAPYPRYKSSWEYVVRLAGLTLDKSSAWFEPFKSLDFAFHEIDLAGMKVDLTVQSGWSRATVDGKPQNFP